MAFQVSPGVQVTEKDFTSIVPAVSTSNGAFCGDFVSGPIEDPVRVSSENELVKLFGKPTAQNYSSWFTAANFLAYGNNLLVCRADSSAARNAVSAPTGGVVAANIRTVNAGSGYSTGDQVNITFGTPSGGVAATGYAVWNQTTGTWTITIENPGSGYSTPSQANTGLTVVNAGSASGTVPSFNVDAVPTSGIKIKNLNDYMNNFINGGGNSGKFAGKFPGASLNNVVITLIDSGNWAAQDEAIKKLFTSAPGTSTFASKLGISNDEMHIIVKDSSTGSVSGVANAILESFEFVSKLSDAKKEDGSSIFYKDVLNTRSKYIWWLDHPLAAEYSNYSTTSTPSSILSGKSAVFNASNKTITVSSATPSDLSGLAAYLSWWNSATDKTSRQIRVSSTTSNNDVFTVTNVTYVATPTPTYTITVLETIVSETEPTCTIADVIKWTWGNSSSTVLADADVAKAMGVLKGAVVNNSTLQKGVNGGIPTTSDIQNAYLLLANTEEYDISLLPVGAVSSGTAKFILDNVVEVRKDCVMFVSPNNNGAPIFESTSTPAATQIVTYRNNSGIDSSYAVMDSGFKYQYDRYNDVYRWIPLSGDVAGICARTDNIADPWYSPGGFNRGQVKNIIKLAFNPGQTDRDTLYTAGINPVVTFKGQGTVLYGDKTLQVKPSAFDRINVRRLFIVLEKAISTAAKFQLFEFNDSFTRSQFKNIVEPFLRNVQGRRGVTDFRVVCDESNNTGDVIDANQFVADIYVKPNRSINYISLNFIAARTGVSFEEIGA